MQLIENSHIIAFIVSSIFTCLYFSNKRLYAASNTMLGAYLIMTLLASFTDCVIMHYYDALMNHPYIFTVLSTIKIILEFHLVHAFMLFVTMNLRNEKHNHIFLIQISFIPVALFTVLMIILSITYANVLATYVPASIKIIYLTNFTLYFLFMIVLIIKHGEMIKTSNRISYLVVGVINIIIMHYAVFINQYLSVYFLMSFNTIIFYSIYYMRRSLVDYSTERFNRAALRSTLEDFYHMRFPFYFLLVYINGYNQYASKKGLSESDRIQKLVADSLPIDNKEHTTFKVLNNCYIVFFRKEKDYLKHVHDYQEYARYPENELADIKITYVYGASTALGVKTTNEFMNFLTQTVDYISVHKCSDFFNITTILSPLQRDWLVKEAINKAIENESFSVAYQPIYNINAGKFDKCESLVRLKDDVIGNISPGEFIPIVEQTGLIVKVEQLMIKKVLEDMSNYNFEAQGIKSVNINLSPIDLVQPEAPIQLAQAVESYGLRTDQIVLEITEGVDIADPEQILFAMVKLYNLGFDFALDDYGTGYSNIARIYNLPLKYIKYDKSLLDLALESNDHQSIMANSMKSFKQIGYDLVVEGVETAEQVDFVSKAGADYIQGYFYSKPLFVDEFLKFINEKNNKA